MLTAAAGVAFVVIGLVYLGTRDGGSTTTSEGGTTGTSGNTTETTRSPASFIGAVSGSYSLLDWRERDGPITMAMDATSGTLLIDEFGFAVWELELDSGTQVQITPGLQCVGIVDEATESLEGVTGEVVVAGEALKRKSRRLESELNVTTS